MNHLMSKIRRNYIHELPLIRIYAFLYLIGVFIGVFGAILSKDLLLFQTSSFLKTSIDIGYFSIFFRQFLSFLLLFFLGLTVVGIPLLPLYPLYKGFSIGVLISISIITSGVQGFAFGTLAFFSQNLMYTFFGYFVCYSSARLSVSLLDLLKGRGKHSATYHEFLNHTYRFLICIPFIALISLWQWKVVPFILQLF